jgi:hypothetical protein
MNLRSEGLGFEVSASSFLLFREKQALYFESAYIVDKIKKIKFL